MLELAEVLDIPSFFKTKSRFRVSDIEALGLLCARFRSAGDQFHLSLMYGRSQSAISEIVNWIVALLDNRWKHLLDWDSECLLSHENLPIYAQVVKDQGAPIDTVFGWPDCTKFFICRPSQYQQVAYNGHDRAHCLKFQAIVIPNGIIAHLYGPVEGRRHDMQLWDVSSIAEKLAEHAVVPNPHIPGRSESFQIYGDATYGLSPHILSPFCGSGVRTADELAWNNLMGKDRVSVENVFAVILNFWPFLQAYWKMKVFGSPVGRYYRVGVL